MRALILVPLMLSACAADLDDQPWDVDPAEAPAPAHIVPRVFLEAPTPASCEHTGLVAQTPEATASRCLDEVFGQDGCLSARISYAYDAGGALAMERSELFAFDFLPGACGPYGDVPRSYVRRFHHDGPTSHVTEARDLEAEPDTRQLQTRDADGRLTQQVEQYADGEGAWRARETQTWSFDADGRTETHRTAWREDAFQQTRYERDEHGRAIAEYRENQNRSWLAIERAYGPEGLETETHYDHEGAPYRRVTYTREGDALVTLEVAFRGAREVPVRRARTSDARHTHERWDQEEERWMLESDTWFDAEGRKTHSERWSRGERFERVEVTYDALGRKVLETYTRPDARDSTHAWLFDDQGRLLQTQQDHDGDGASDRTETYLYDAQGWLFEHRQDLDGDGVIDQRAVTHRACQ